MGTTHTAVKRLSLVFTLTLFATSIWILGAAPPTNADVLANVPGPADAQSREDIWIDGNSQFNPANGVRKGRGTKKNPFVISGWDVGTIYIKDTSAHLVVKDNVIDRLHLNWNGGHVRLVNNDIGNLRVNENIERTGAPTSGLIARNQFDVVGQLRHFDGVFEDNTVGSPAAAALPFVDDRAVNFDGFNGARFSDNTIYGYVDVRLHGHHHGSGFRGKSHHHSLAMEEGKHHHGHKKAARKIDHSRRYHRVLVSNNRIYSAGPWALRYFDQAHSANDRTAASETNEALNQPHVHFTRVLLKNNKLFGSGLAVDVFNAEDELHKKIGKGWVYLVGNTIKLQTEIAELFSRVDGIVVNQARGLMLHIARNKVGWMDDVESPTSQFEEASGIRLGGLDRARIHIRNNKLDRLEYGVYASQFTESVRWWVSKLSTKDVNQPIYYDNTVANHPRRGR